MLAQFRGQIRNPRQKLHKKTLKIIINNEKWLSYRSKSKKTKKNENIENHEYLRYF